MKSLINFFIERYRSTFTILSFIIASGFASLSQIPASAYADINIPYVFVSTFYDGVSPEDAERLIAKPLENKLKTVDELVKIESYSRESMSYIILEFPTSYPVEKSVQDVKDVVDEVIPELPQDAEQPQVIEFTLDEFPVMNINIASQNATDRELLNLAKSLQDEIEKLPGILEANINGIPDEVLEAEINKTKLDSYRVSPYVLYNAISQNNKAIPAGKIVSSTGEFYVSVPSVFETLEDVGNIPILEDNNAVVTLDDLVKLKRTFKDKDSIANVNGERAVAVTIFKKSDAREVVVARQVNNIVDEAKKFLPEGMEIIITEDRTDMSVELVSELMGNIMTALVLVMTLVVAAMGIRSSLLVGLSIPTCILFACLFLSPIGYTFNFMVCFGILISLGMLIDGAVVVVEYADRKMSEGYDKKEAYRIAGTRMFWPVVVSILTTLAIFFPFIFWEGMSGQFMRPMIVTLVAVLSGSILYALIFTPAIGSIFGNLGNRNDKSLENSLVLESGDPKSLGGFTGRYARFLDKVLEYPFKVITFIFLIVISIYVVFFQHGPGGNFFVEEDPDTIIVEVEGRGNLNTEEKFSFLQEVQEVVMTVPGPETISMQQAGTDDPRERGNSDRLGAIFIEMPFDKDVHVQSGADVLLELQDKLKDTPGLNVTIRERNNGPPVGSPIEIDVFGSDYDMVYEATEALANYMKNSIPGVMNTYTTIPTKQLKWKIKIDKEKASQYGVETADIGAAIQFMTNGVKVGEYRPDDVDEELDIRIRFPKEERRLDMFENLNVLTNFGSVPLSSFVSYEPEYEAPYIRRVSGERAFTIAADYAPGALTQDVIPLLNQWIADAQEYNDLEFIFGGEQEETDKNAAFMRGAAAIGVFLMAILLTIQLNSFFQVWIVISAIFLSTAGVYLGLTITQTPMSFLFTNLGIIALAGIVVNNNIVLVDTYNILRRENKKTPLKEIIIRTASQRLRPIILTTATTVIGLLPLASGFGVDLLARDVEIGGRVAEWWSPMSFAVVWGLTFSAFLTLILTPCWLMLPEKIKHFFVQTKSVKSNSLINE